LMLNGPLFIVDRFIARHIVLLSLTSTW